MIDHMNAKGFLAILFQELPGTKLRSKSPLYPRLLCD